MAPVVLRNLARRALRPLAPFSFGCAVASADGMVALAGARLLYRLAAEARVGCIVEIGSFRGRSTVALARGSLAGAGTPVFAVDPHEEFISERGRRFGPINRAEFFRTMLRTGCWRLVRLVNLSSETVAPNWSSPISLLFIDGDHSEFAVRRDWDCWSEHLAPNGTVVFDDSDWPGPQKLIQDLLGKGWMILETCGPLTVMRREQSLC
jgi:predicted O-methyltransferase YrrM